ncbi:ABC-2 type transport system ATP-binding protein [Nonomuraea soli]|uniref:ABC-2 type transport system ATP-binding protein n=1 Tax=Nonomuraea soli TaxID=1032476 RepID=A0A7W0CKX5_9ACTN|nr:ABC transporter ATP-binding protein [Nonomuraea soli]MBA2893058.1 ABC-2 type transport system ATP-binding protein [Nonomuraea soli]
MTTAIDVTGLRQSYGDFEAVRGITFDVRQGELFALLGTNGAGKTTTMEVLAGYSRPSGGSVRVLGLDPVKARRQLRPRMSIMLQEAGFLGDLTVAETVELWRGMAKDAGREPLTGNPIELVELTSKAKVKVKQLSGGQKRRLDLALAILSLPEVLFLDEPTTGMDPEARQRTWEIVRSLREAGTTILLTTHYLEEAERLADRLAIMHEGVIRIAGTVDEVVATSGDQLSFRLPERHELLPAIEDRPPSIAGGRAAYKVYGSAHGAMRELLDWADKYQVDLERLEVRPGTLDDVFLRVAKEAK